MPAARDPYDRPPTAASEVVADRGGSYSQILRSSALVGGATAINVVVGIFRTKAMAVLLGPAGFGLMGAFSAISDLARSLAGMGINNSGVRQIAESVGTGDSHSIARTAKVLRRVAVLLGLIGVVLLMLLAGPISKLTFGSMDNAGSIALLSLAVFFRLVSDGQLALLQGTRRIGDMARVGVWGALLGSAASIFLVFWLRERGVVLSIVALAVATAAMSWWYSRRVAIDPVALTSKDVRQDVGELLRLGMAFMASGLLMMGSAYAVRIILIRHEGLDAAGLYQAAWTLGGLYVAFVLQAMGADFYPRLVAASVSNPESNRLVNEQALVSLLLAGVGVLATLAFAPLVISIFYSKEFGAAAETLRWISLGMMLRVITWPMGYIIVAANARKTFVITELAWAAFSVGLTWVLVPQLGLRGAGIAFFASYVFHGLMIYPIVRHAYGFKWTRENLRIGALVLTVIGATFIAPYTMTATGSLVLGAIVVFGFGIYAVTTIINLVPETHLPKRLAAAIDPLRRLRRG